MSDARQALAGLLAMDIATAGGDLGHLKRGATEVHYSGRFGNDYLCQVKNGSGCVIVLLFATFVTSCRADKSLLTRRCVFGAI